MNPGHPLVSVVIPTHNNLVVLKQCLDSWRSTRQVHPYELLVIEDGCTDGTPAFLREMAATEWGQAHLRWFHEDDVHELRCDNRGFREARGACLIIWQDDMFLRGDWMVPELVQTLERNKEIGLIALSRGLLLHHVADPVKTWEELVDWRRLESTIGSRLWNWFNLYEVDAVCRPWMVRKVCLDKVGLLDETFAPCEWDETDLCFRLREQGWKIATHGYERDGAYQHLGSTTIGKMPSEKHKAIALRNGVLCRDRWQQQIKNGDSRSRVSWARSLGAGDWLRTLGQMVGFTMRP